MFVYGIIAGHVGAGLIALGVAGVCFVLHKEFVRQDAERASLETTLKALDDLDPPA